MKKTKVDVYRNLNKDCLSIKSRETENYGKVVDYAQKINLKDVRFVVRDTGREKANNQDKRNVHAFARGKVSSQNVNNLKTREITYNPFKYENFVTVKGKKPVESAKYALVSTNGVRAFNLEFVK